MLEIDKTQRTLEFGHGNQTKKCRSGRRTITGGASFYDKPPAVSAAGD